MKILNLALSKSKYFYNIPYAVDGYIFDYVEDISETNNLQAIAMLRLEDIIKSKNLLPKKKWYSIFQDKEDRYKGVHINLYITGFTSMLISVLNVCYALGITVTCYHCDRKNGKFFPQEVYS